MRAKVAELQAEKVQNKHTRLVYKRFKERYPALSDDIEKVVYQYLPGAIRVRIIDLSFKGLSYFQRHDLVADILESLPDYVERSILLLLLMTPEEANGELSGMELEFDNPTGEHM